LKARTRSFRSWITASIIPTNRTVQESVTNSSIEAAALRVQDRSNLSRIYFVWKKISVDPFSLSFSPTGKTIVTKAGFARDSNIVLADAETGQIRVKLPTNDCEFEPFLFVDPTCHPIQVNQRGKLIMTHSRGNMRLWDSENGRLIDHLTEARQPAYFSPNGRWLATGSWQKNTMLLWEVIRN
jgi:WD40 repeat protein